MKCEEFEILCECDQTPLPEAAREHMRICQNCAAYSEKARREDLAFHEAFSVFFNEKSWQRVKARLHDRLDQQSLRKNLSQKASIIARWWPLAAAASAVLAAYIAFEQLIPPTSDSTQVKIVPLDDSAVPIEEPTVNNHAKEWSEFQTVLRRQNVFGELGQLKTYCQAAGKNKALAVIETVELYLERLAYPSANIPDDIRSETTKRFSACLTEMRKELRQDRPHLPAALNATNSVLAVLEKIPALATEAKTAVSPSSEEPAALAFAAAEELYADGDYQAAVEAYLLLAAQQPETNHATCAQYSAAYIQQKKLGRLDLAAANYREISTHATHSHWAQNAAFRLAEINEVLNSPAIAAFAYQEFLAQAPRHPRAAEAREKISYLHAAAADREAVPPGWAHQFVAGRHTVLPEEPADNLAAPEKVQPQEYADGGIMNWGSDAPLDVPLAVESKNDLTNADEPQTFLLSPEKENSASKTVLPPGFNLKRSNKSGDGAHATGNLIGPHSTSTDTATKDADAANRHAEKSAADKGTDDTAKGNGPGAATDKSGGKAGGNAGGGKGPAAGGGSPGGAKGPAAGGGSPGGAKGPATGSGSPGGGKGRGR
jgi:TolA-binding protein